MRGGVLPDEILIRASQTTFPLPPFFDFTDNKVALASPLTSARAALLQASANAGVANNVTENAAIMMDFKKFINVL